MLLRSNRAGSLSLSLRYPKSFSWSEMSDEGLDDEGNVKWAPITGDDHPKKRCCNSFFIGFKRDRKKSKTADLARLWQPFVLNVRASFRACLQSTQPPLPCPVLSVLPLFSPPAACSATRSPATVL